MDRPDKIGDAFAIYRMYVDDHMQGIRVSGYDQGALLSRLEEKASDPYVKEEVIPALTTIDAFVANPLNLLTVFLDHSDEIGADNKQAFHQGFRELLEDVIAKYYSNLDIFKDLDSKDLIYASHRDFKKRLSSRMLKFEHVDWVFKNRLLSRYTSADYRSKIKSLAYRVEASDSASRKYDVIF